jgi:hypothetical protein
VSARSFSFAAVVLLSALVPASAGAGAAAPLAALTASPAHVTLLPNSSATIRVTNAGLLTVVADVTATGFALSPRGEPKVLAAQSRTWIEVRPARLTLAPGERASVDVASALPSGAPPGDHPAVVLVTTRPGAGDAVAVRMRLGVAVVVRVPGRIVHRLELGPLRVVGSGRDRALRVVVANNGNAVEWLRRGRVEVSLFSHRRLTARLRTQARELLPHARGVFELRCPHTAAGWTTARATLRTRTATLQRSVRLKL